MKNLGNPRITTGPNRSAVVDEIAWAPESLMGEARWFLETAAGPPDEPFRNLAPAALLLLERVQQFRAQRPSVRSRGVKASAFCVCCERPAVGDANLGRGESLAHFFGGVSGGVVFGGLMGCGLCRGALLTEIHQSARFLPNLAGTLLVSHRRSSSSDTLHGLLTGTPRSWCLVPLVWCRSFPLYVSTTGQLQHSAFAGVRGCACF